MRTLIISLILISLTVCGIYLYQANDQENDDQTKPVSDENILPTEQFIITHLMHEDGTIRTDLTKNAKNKEALSESMGLWMEYLVLKDDPAQFERAVDTLQTHFLSKEKLVMWEIKGNKKATTNALIDDLRIIEALYTVGEREERKDYLKLAKEMSQAVLHYNRINNDFIDFYDHEFNDKGQLLTLSYINPKSLEKMVDDGLFSDHEMNELKGSMQAIPNKTIFYPIGYDLNAAAYDFQKTVNLIDQLYIAIYLEGFNVDTTPFYDWIRETYNENKLLYGRYDQESLEKSVDYESIAVYALAIIYGLERSDPDFALELYDQMKKHQITDPNSVYLGGYVTSGETHSFDNLLALIAERKLLNEHLIN